MSHKCKNCGETHLGDVNRCWKCGVEIVVTSEPLAEDSADHSPFSAVTVVAGNDVAQAQSRRNSLSIADGLTAAALILGVSSYLASGITGWTVAPALTGLVCGLFAFQHRRNWLVILAILICCLAVFSAGWTAYDSLVELYQREFAVDSF